MKRAPPEGSNRTRTGTHAEEKARHFLEGRGLRLVERNVRCRGGELDLVMLDGEELVFVEVRYRATGDLVDPALTVGPVKRRRIMLAAVRYLQQRPQFSEHALRFDVVALTGSLDRPHCDWIRCAFTADDLHRVW